MNLKAWIEATRLRTLPVSVAGVIAGSGCAAVYGKFQWLPASICLLFAVVAQIASNFANEYYDYAYGFDKRVARASGAALRKATSRPLPCCGQLGFWWRPTRCWV